ncbi:ASCH domain-containing protein [Salinicola halophilus]|uniref:ASCH domain-containing protein n=1 Tax=Salinicola halophilus TaxID=184065 RepID=UPI001EF7D460|nr:ASCH domain-containing protein [Salinicola halophilus]
MTSEQQRFLARYREHRRSLGHDDLSNVVVEAFGDTPELADECARLIDAGIKRASCGLTASYSAVNERLPTVGQLTVVLDSLEAPVCIVALTSVTTCRFDEVTPAFAALEGEGDGTYAWWRREHVRFFRREAARLGVEFTDASELVLERFEKVFA